MSLSIASKTTALRRLVMPGVQMPVYLLMFVTNRCNATFEHCFHWRELNTKIKQELSIDEYDRLARGLGPMLQTTFTGGSPELRKDLPDIVERFYEHCRPTNMTFCMLGHSTDRILSQAEDMLKRCTDQKIKIGISLDGLGEVHDRLRGIPGLFERVEIDGKPLAIPAIPPKLSATPGGTRWSGPAIGAHTGEVLGEWLGMDAEAVNGLRQRGVI